MVRYLEDKVRDLEKTVDILLTKKMESSPAGIKLLVENIELRVEKLESFCADLLSVLHNSEAREIERSQSKIAKMKAGIKERTRKRSLKKRKPIRRKRAR